jgi:hypothetical protein
MAAIEYTFVVPESEYQRYWDENYVYGNDPSEDIEYLILYVNYFKSPDDKAWEYSIKWEENTGELSGEKTGINTSSIFALLSTKWKVVRDSDDEVSE